METMYPVIIAVVLDMTIIYFSLAILAIILALWVLLRDTSVTTKIIISLIDAAIGLLIIWLK